MHRRADRSARESENRLSAGDTIAAISTAPGPGAIALVRLSGATSIEIADRVFRAKQKPSQFAPNVQHLGEIFGGDDLIDQAMVAVHRAPASYTGEDLVEISCHGGMLVTSRVLGACLQAGARAARPGEFTERGYLNGKMDLTQAEAVIDLIRANTELALRAATEQLEGKLGALFGTIRDELVLALAHVDASIDFPEEDIAPEQGAQLGTRIAATHAKVEKLLATAHRGRIIREGVRVVIFGPTNAGKSSLLNRLLGYDRAIVSEIHGTTRDTIEEVVNLGGVAMRLRDTAGLRDTSDELEREGVTRTHQALEAADVRLLVLDASEAKKSDLASDGALVVLNKSDLPEHVDWRDLSAVRISCATGAGFDLLEREILAKIGMRNLQPESVLSVNARHADRLRAAAGALQRATENIHAGMSAEYIAVDLNEAIRAIEDIIGMTDNEAVRDAIFSQFCIGK